MNSLAPLIVLLTALSLGACSNRDSSDVPIVGENPSTVPDAATDDLPSTPGATPDTDGDAAVDPAPIIDVTPQNDPTEDEPASTEDSALTDGLTEDSTDDPIDGPTDAPADDMLIDSDAEDQPLDPMAPILSEGEGILVPAIPGDLNAARVLDGLHLVLARTIVDLNERVRTGVELSEQQNDCLGTYEPALGDPVFGVDCSRALATEPVSVFVERGAFHDTEACRADLLAGNGSDCVIAFASVFTRTVFEQTPPERRPRPLPGSGVVIRYAIDGPVFEVASDDQALLGAFSCRIDLATGSTLPGAFGNCNATLGDVATRFDELLADVR